MQTPNVERRTPNIEIRSRLHGHARGALEFAPAYPRALECAEDRFPDAIAEHRPVNEAHRQDPPRGPDWFALQNAGERGEDHVHGEERDHERHDGAPGAEGQRGRSEEHTSELQSRFGISY